MTDDEVHRSFYEANSMLLTNYYEKRLKVSLEEARKLYREENIEFRGSRQH
tara:strand:+ start:2178 stop:2330 length:153 start_codon:yes stop_codon:yes gene_type:complete